MQPHNCVVAYAIMGEAEKETVFAANAVIALNLKNGMEMRIGLSKRNIYSLLVPAQYSGGNLQAR
jgi:hypothetical protein